MVVFVPICIRNRFMSEKYNVIADAIKSCKNICCVYKNQIRYLTPHFLGHITAQDNKESCTCYQFSGGSNSDQECGWKSLDVEKLLDIYELNTTIHTTGYQGPPNGLDVEYQLSIEHLRNKEVICH